MPGRSPSRVGAHPKGVGGEPGIGASGTKDPGGLPLVYVAGPYTHPDPVENTHLAIKAADELLASGAVVPYVAHLSLLWHLVSPKPYGDWLAYDLDVLVRCDALLRLPGASAGADGEVATARAHGIPVFSDTGSLYAWAQERAHPYGAPEVPSSSGVVIGIGHQKRQGKDTVGTILADLVGARTTSFAGALKTVTSKALTADPPIDAALAARLAAEGLEAVKASDPRLRQFLIALGNAVRDVVHPDTWVHVVTERCLADPGKHWVITDVRYRNEVEAVRRLGGLLVKVERPGEAVASDAADDALAGFCGWDLIVTNDGTLDDLGATVARDLVPAVLRRSRENQERHVRSGRSGQVPVGRPEHEVPPIFDVRAPDGDGASGRGGRGHGVGSGGGERRWYGT